MWKTLGIEETTFWPYKNEALKDRVPQLTVRTAEGELAAYNGPTLNTG